jgi:hypothetical protein
LKVGDAVEVLWFDAHGANTGGSWIDLAEAKRESEPITIRTVGLLVVDAPSHLLVAQSLDSSAEKVDNILSIPSVNIKKARTLR